MSNMNVKNTRLPGVLLITPPTIFEDFRGSYVELYNEEEYRRNGIDVKFIQDDMSTSTRHVLRGLHGDGHTHKLITCPIGKIYVIVVNNDPSHPQYRQWESFTLSESNRLQVLVPPLHGLGHLVLSDRAVFHYKQSSYYHRESQFTIRWNDPAYGLWWPISAPILSQRDGS
jgi:dTDP-4-dehydrorhamnose 3,5-epimerase